MASLTQDNSGTWRIRFRVSGIQAYRSLQTTSYSDALRAQDNVEEILRDLKFGRREIPHDVDPVEWVMSSGKKTGGEQPTSAWTLSTAIKKYFDSIPEGAKEPGTLKMEGYHCETLERILGKTTRLRAITQADLQNYVATRSREAGKGDKKISPQTISKELMTLRQIWKNAKAAGAVSHDIPSTHLKLPKSRSKPPFQTWEQIQRQVDALESESAKKDLWDSLFLREYEIQELLAHFEAKATMPWVHPAVAFAAFTGARRSEVFRALVSDVDFEHQRVRLREKKRKKDVDFSFRFVVLHPTLAGYLDAWIRVKPGSSKLFVNPGGLEVTVDQTNHHFNHPLTDTKWSVVRGWHVLRHSFASICASKGIRERTISEWLGHETEEMKARYQHLFPEQVHAEMQLLFDMKRPGAEAGGCSTPGQSGRRQPRHP